MRLTDPILSDEEWRALHAQTALDFDGYAVAASVHAAHHRADPKVIAATNDSVPDTFPAKITAARLEAVFNCLGASDASWRDVDEAKAFLRALQMYLPPDQRPL